jgi:DnaK suppressor protein
MPVKKPSVKPSKAKKTVSAKAAVKPSAKSAVPAKPAPRKTTAPKVPQRPAARVAAAVPVVNREKPPVDMQIVNDDIEGSEVRMSLLSGPRNVKPYVVRKDEEYMSKEQLDHFRRILGIWKQDLMQEVDRTMLHMKDEAANFPDPNDRATQESEFSLELRTRDRERKLIRKIDEALKRIDDGSMATVSRPASPSASSVSRPGRSRR